MRWLGSETIDSRLASGLPGTSMRGSADQRRRAVSTGAPRWPGSPRCRPPASARPPVWRGSTPRWPGCRPLPVRPGRPGTGGQSVDERDGAAAGDSRTRLRTRSLRKTREISPWVTEIACHSLTSAGAARTSLEAPNSAHCPLAAGSAAQDSNDGVLPAVARNSAQKLGSVCRRPARAKPRSHACAASHAVTAAVPSCAAEMASAIASAAQQGVILSGSAAPRPVG